MRRSDHVGRPQQPGIGLNSATTLVSITIGGNDAGFASIMETCVLQSDSACISAISSAGSFVANGQKLGYLPALSAATG